MEKIGKWVKLGAFKIKSTSDKCTQNKESPVLGAGKASRRSLAVLDAVGRPDVQVSSLAGECAQFKATIAVDSEKRSLRPPLPEPPAPPPLNLTIWLPLSLVYSCTALWKVP